MKTWPALPHLQVVVAAWADTAAWVATNSLGSNNSPGAPRGAFFVEKCRLTDCRWKRHTRALPFLE